MAAQSVCSAPWRSDIHAALGTFVRAGAWSRSTFIPLCDGLCHVVFAALEDHVVCINSLFIRPFVTGHLSYFCSEDGANVNTENTLRGLHAPLSLAGSEGVGGFSFRKWCQVGFQVAYTCLELVNFKSQGPFFNVEIVPVFESIR